MSEPFGFEVEYHEEESEFEPAGWCVSLPHQCDRWDIAGDYCHPMPLDDAIAEFERFIAEANEALSALRAGRNWPEVTA